MDRKCSFLILSFLVIALLLSGCFEKKVMLSISIDGQGIVTKSPDDQGKGYKKDAVAQLEAIPAEGWRFVRWDGDITGDTPKTSIKMDSSKTVKAVFVKEYPLKVTVEGQGTVSQEIVAAKDNYANGTTVILTATPAEGWRFDHWEGGLTGSTNPNTIVMDSAKTVTAVFVKAKYPLQITVQGEGTVSQEILANTRNGDYEYGTTLRLTATPAEGWRFDHWEGDLTGSTNPNTIVMDSAKTVTAVFILARLRVPEDYSSIQAAIDVAIAGDIIVISPGTYFENIRFNGKSNITLTSTDPLDPAVVKNTIINGNQKGACIVAENGETDITISGFTITNGSGRSIDSFTYGGGIYAPGATLTLTNSTISGNTASYGGGIYAPGATLTLTDSTISGNTASAGGGIYVSDGTVTLTDSTISGNTASTSGGGIWAGGALTLTDSTISGNTASYGGGIYAAPGGTLTLTNITISDNTASWDGGGIYAAFDATLTLTNSTISDNTASKSSGGGICAPGVACTLILTDSTISGNTAFWDGGGIYASDDAILTLTNITISDNTASLDGGGIYAYGVILTLIDSTISGNIASTSVGGGIYAYDKAKLKLQNNIIKDNAAATNGGGIWKSTSSTILNLNDEPLTTPAAVEAINDFSNNTPDNVYFE